MTIVYSSPTTLVISPASLATSATFVAGQESTQVDNTSNKYMDAFLNGLATVGTTPTINTVINLYFWGSHTSLATTALDVLDGTDSAETITSAGVLQTMFALGASAIVDATTSNIGYFFRDLSIASILGVPVLPPYWGMYLAHNTGVNLHATAGNHVFSFVGVTW